MASTQFAVLAIVAVLLPSMALATEYIVGDDSGWTNNGYNYTQWAMGKAFYVGDTLVFNYPSGKHNVFKVATPDAFKNCKKPDPKLALTSGHDIVVLQSPGKKWYICGVGEHCSKFNQKFAITVEEADGPAPAPMPYSPTPSTWAPPPSTAFTAMASSGLVAVVAAIAALAMF